MIPCKIIDINRLSYDDALSLQRQRVERLRTNTGSESLILLEHDPVITLGRNASNTSLLHSPETLRAQGISVMETDRGGDITYHGPGQLVGYPIIHLEPPRRDIKKYVHDIEEVLMRTLGVFSIETYRHDIHRGVWTRGKKIASVGIRISRWITSHGFALNVTTDLSHFSFIHPCGIIGCEMTTMEHELGFLPEMGRVKATIAESFSTVFERQMISACSEEWLHDYA